jgi:hypothetical protein
MEAVMPERSEPSDAGLAAWHYAHRDELDREQGSAVEVEFAPTLSVTMSFRLPGSEADAIRTAARTAGMSLSEWIRRVCAEAAADDGGLQRRQAIDAELAGAEREIAKMQRRLAAARRQNLGTQQRKKAGQASSSTG